MNVCVKLPDLIWYPPPSSAIKVTGILFTVFDMMIFIRIFLECKLEGAQHLLRSKLYL